MTCTYCGHSLDSDGFCLECKLNVKTSLALLKDSIFFHVKFRCYTCGINSNSYFNKGVRMCKKCAGIRFNRYGCQDCRSASGKVRNAKRKEENRKINKGWQQGNSVRNAISTAKYRYRKSKATPLWLSESQQAEIDRFYEESNRLTTSTGIVHHVDHIVPIKGEYVCGLHVPWNLQLLTRLDNISKNNTFDKTIDPASW